MHAGQLVPFGGVSHIFANPSPHAPTLDSLNDAGSPMVWLVALIGVPILVWGLSHAVETLLRESKSPSERKWDLGVPTHYMEVHGTRLRYVATGEGEPLVLLHTLRTQMDLFRDVIDDLSQNFRVYSFDYPGHGWSETPREEYTPDFFYRYVRGFLDARQIKNPILVGESIGAPLALRLASENPASVRKVVAINSYDYGQGRGIFRGSLLSNVAFSMGEVPVVGETIWRLRFRQLFRAMIAGSVYRPGELDPAFVHELYEAGNQAHRYEAFLSLVRHFSEWTELRSMYENVDVPVLLIYGEHDWSRPSERQSTRSLIPGARMETVPDGGHLLSLEKPQSVVKLITEFATPVKEETR